MLFFKKQKINYFEEKLRKCQRNGWRSAIYSTHKLNKDKYIGNWKNDKKEGKGIEYNRNNFIYQGDWKNGMKHGFGILYKITYSKKPQKIYSGYWSFGKKQGLGVHWYHNKFYKGNFLRNKKNGFGRMYWCDGQYYEGMWENNLFHGKGILTLTNGNRYEGDFVNGKKEGGGIFYHVKAGQMQNGQWINDICVKSVIENFY